MRRVRRTRRRPVTRAAPVAKIRLARAQILPVGLPLHAAPFDGDKFAPRAEQPLDDALGWLVASFSEVVLADDAVRSTKQSASQ